MLYTSILRGLSPERFAHILAGSGRKAKETYFARHGIRNVPTVGRVKLGAGHKTQARISALYQAVQKREDEPMGEEILRLYLLGQRPLLATALDHLGIAHEDGLTESDEVSRLATLTPIERAELIALVVDKKVATQEDAELYLTYMAANHTHEQQAQAEQAAEGA
jgi:hypothetical protein